MNRVTSEVAQEVSVFLQKQDVDSRPRQEVSQRHTGRAAASDNDAALQFVR